MPLECQLSLGWWAGVAPLLRIVRAAGRTSRHRPAAVNRDAKSCLTMAELIKKYDVHAQSDHRLEEAVA